MLIHMRPEVARGHLWLIFPDVRRNSILGYRNRGGTLGESEMPSPSDVGANVLAACARLLDLPRAARFEPDEGRQGGHACCARDPSRAAPLLPLAVLARFSSRWSDTARW